MKDFKIIEIMELFDEGEVTTADQIDRPQKALDREMFEDANKRLNQADGGMLVQPNLDGSRPEYAPKKGHKEQKEKLLNWLNNNKDTFDFANSSSADVLKASKVNLGVGAVQKLLSEEGIKTKTAIAKTQDKPKYTKKVLEELREGLPRGISLEEGRPGKYYYRIMLKGGKAGKETYRNSMVANEANKQLIIDDFNRVSKEYYPGRLTDEEFKNLRLANKDMTTEEFAKFLDNQGKTTYLGDKWNKSSVSSVQNRLDIGKGTTGPQTVRTIEEAKKIAKTYPGGKFLLQSGASDSEILKFVSNKISQDKQALGGKKGFPVGNTKENKMWRNFYNSSLKADGRIKLLTAVPTDADGSINWKKKDASGVPAWKKAKFFDNKTGATYTWGGNYKPGDLAKQVDAAYGKGFFAKSVKVYDEQAAFNKQTFNGRALNEIFREGLLKKELEIKLNRSLTNSKADQKLLKNFYALRKPNFSFTEAHHVEGVGKNPFRMEVSYRAANRAQNDLLNRFNAGNITKEQYAEGMKRLSDTKGGIRYKTDGRFIGTTATPESIIKAAAQDTNIKPLEIQKLLASFSANPQCRVTFGRGNKDGGRIGYATGPADLSQCAISGKNRLEKVIKGGVKLGEKEGLLARQILKAGRSLGSAFTLSGLFGPAALAFTAAAEAGFVGYDMLTTGKTFKETIGDSLLNYALGEKTKIDPNKELFKRFSGLGYSDEQIGKFANVLNQTNTLNTILKQDLKVGNLKDQVKAFREQPKDQFMIADDEMLQTDAAIRAEQKLKDEQKNLENLLTDYRSQPPVGLNMEDTILGDMASGKFQETQQDLQAANIFADIEKEKTAANRLAGLEGAISEKARADRIAGLEQDYLNLLQERGPQLTPFAGGGIAGLSGGIDEGPQTVSMNPDSQGLRSLKKRVKNI